MNFQNISNRANQHSLHHCQGRPREGGRQRQRQTYWPGRLPEHNLLDERAGPDHADSTTVCLLHQSLVDREDTFNEGEGSHVGFTKSDRKALLCRCST